MNRLLATLVILVLSLAVPLTLSAEQLTPPLRAAATRCFAPEETGQPAEQCIEGRLLEHWEQNGGLPVFGYPLTAARPEVNRDTGHTYLTQWFERNRFELHSENSRPYDVLLGRLGDDLLVGRGENWAAIPREDGPQPGCHWFGDTGRNVCNQTSDLGFRSYWETHGLEFDDQPGTSEAESLALFGLPLTPARLETNSSGHTVLTQWFERARFEWHPDNPDQFKVLLGRLGDEIRRSSGPPPLVPAPNTAPSAPPNPQPVFGTLIGRVTISSGLSNSVQAAAGAEVSLLDLPDLTVEADGDGTYILHNVPAGQHFVFARTSAGTSDLLAVNIQAGSQRLDINLKVFRPAANVGLIVGRVVGSNGRPVAGATVWLHGTLWRTTSDPDGSFWLVVMPGNVAKKLTVIAATSERWGFAPVDGDETTVQLDRQPPVPPAPRRLYDLIDQAPEAEWRNGNGQVVLNLPEDDPRGSVRLRERATLEDGSRPARALQIRPQETGGRRITGVYSRPITIREGDLVTGRYGFAESARAGNVTISIAFCPGEGPQCTPVPLFGLSGSSSEGQYSGRVKPVLNVFPTELIGQRGRFHVTVDAGESAAQDVLLWAELQLVRER